MIDLSRTLLCAHMWVMCAFLMPLDRNAWPMIGMSILMLLCDKFNKYAADSARRQSNDRI